MYPDSCPSHLKYVSSIYLSVYLSTDHASKHVSMPMLRPLIGRNSKAKAKNHQDNGADVEDGDTAKTSGTTHHA